MILGPERFTNREISWLRFNERVLSEAFQESNPLLERLKFLAIFESNLDEFYMIRVSGLVEQVETGVGVRTPDGLTPVQQLEQISAIAVPMRRAAAKLWTDTLRPALAEERIRVLDASELTDQQIGKLQTVFLEQVFPVCTPLILHPAVSFPFISSRSLNLAIELRDEAGSERIGRVKVPQVLPRLVRLHKARHEFVFLEDVIRLNLPLLFPQVSIVSSSLFRVIRDADVEIRELEAGDLIELIQESLHRRRFGDAVLLETSDAMPGRVRKRLQSLLNLDSGGVTTVPGVLGLEALWEIAEFNRPDLRFPTHHASASDKLETPARLFQRISQGELLLHHPFDSFGPVEVFTRSASVDDSVIAIKQTLYRVGIESPIVESLLEAAAKGKQVAAMVELKARFDESNNLVWAKALERAGVHVAYGFPDLKTHCKLCLVVRREGKGLKMYAHIGTGNYNPSTSRIYTDFGLFTADTDVTQDISELFNVLTGFSKQQTYRKLLVAPGQLRPSILAKIDRERRHAEKRGSGRIAIKVNSLVDPEMIDALYDAAAAGANVELVVRGICCLRPGLPQLSENIKVISVVGQFLEHSRMYYFANDGAPELWIGSADLMQRNLDRRIEVLAPVQNSRNIEYLIDVVFGQYWRDNTNAWTLKPDGTYERVNRSKSGSLVTAQDVLKLQGAIQLLES